MKQNSPYSVFDKFIFRAPALHTGFDASTGWRSDIVAEALYIASPSFCQELSRIGRDAYEDLNKDMRITLMKYLTRMNRRCTPFGLFAGVGIGNIGTESCIEIDEDKSFIPHLRLDMNYICSLIQHISSLADTRRKTKYTLNSSVYALNGKYRYIEYKYIGGKRKHYLSEIDSDEYTDSLLKEFPGTREREELVRLLQVSGVEKEEAESYIESLIDSQIIVDEFYPRVTGDDLLEGTIADFTRIGCNEELLAELTTIQSELQSISNLKRGQLIPVFRDIETRIENLGVSYDKKFLFQVDLNIRPANATLSDKIRDQALRCLEVLNKFTRYQEAPILKRFKEEFYKKYEDQEIPLMEALDSDIGIGFGNLVPGNVDQNYLIDDLIFKAPASADQTLSTIDQLILSKYYTAGNELVIGEEDLEGLTANWQNLPSTLSSLIEIVMIPEVSEDFTIVMGSASGASAANIISRFAYIDERIRAYVDEILAKEMLSTPENKLIAEIVHLPQSRTGNILYRENLRSHEIPFLAKPGVEDENVVSLADLRVSVPGGKYIKLVSAKLNKEIVPRLTNAHSFYNDSLPPYHFLCMLQMQETRGAVAFRWPDVIASKEFLPRVRYENTIIAPAIWNFKQKHSKDISGKQGSMMHQSVLDFKEKYKLPNRVLLVEGDNKLLIDFMDFESVLLFESKIKNKNFRLEEYFEPLDGKSFIKSDKGCYQNQVVISFYKNEIN